MVFITFINKVLIIKKIIFCKNSAIVKLVIRLFYIKKQFFYRFSDLKLKLERKKHKVHKLLIEKKYFFFVKALQKRVAYIGYAEYRIL